MTSIAECNDHRFVAIPAAFLCPHHSTFECVMRQCLVNICAPPSCYKFAYFDTFASTDGSRTGPTRRRNYGSNGTMPMGMGTRFAWHVHWILCKNHWLLRLSRRGTRPKQHNSLPRCCAPIEIVFACSQQEIQEAHEIVGASQ